MQSLITDNPIVRREARVRFWREWTWRRKVAAVCGATALAALVAFWTRGLRGGAGPVERFVLMAWYIMIVATAAALIGARSVAGEREVRTWEQLLISRLRPMHLIVGKILGVAWRTTLLIIITAPAVWIWTLYVDPRWSPSPINLTALLFQPAGLTGGGSYGGGVDIGLLWLFLAGVFWMVQAATIGVFASLRYRSTITSAIVAVIMLAMALFLDWAFLMLGGEWFAESSTGLGLPKLVAISAGCALVWPAISTFILIALATYEFREFDRWIQGVETAAGR